MPKGLEYMPFKKFERLFEPMINNPLPLFEFFKEGHKVNVLEVFIALVIFCHDAEYEDRVQLIFNVFDVDGGGSLDRREVSKLLQATIYGLTKLAGIPSPPKTKVADFIANMFSEIDEDGSGVVEYDELKSYIDNSMEIQDFILRYSRVQTIVRA